jgi:hypothetical protein
MACPLGAAELEEDGAVLLVPELEPLGPQAAVPSRLRAANPTTVHRNVWAGWSWRGAVQGMEVVSLLITRKLGGSREPALWRPDNQRTHLC